MALSGLMAGFFGIAPHVLHHVGPLAGAALFGGLGGSLLFGVIGFAATTPFLLRLRRRSGGWRLPAVMLAAFAVIFSISTFVIGPAISEGGNGSSTPSPSAPVGPEPGTSSSHEEHH
jgi:predicted PurR-regulated permease PerM